MTDNPASTTLTDIVELPATQCPYCGSLMLFIMQNPAQQSATWACPACHSMKTRDLPARSRVAEIAAGTR